MVSTGYLVTQTDSTTSTDIGDIFALSSSGAPLGSTMAFLGIRDPVGWIICDGVVRTDNQDGKYNNLKVLNIGSGGSGSTNYTPPITNTTPGTSGGGATVTLTTSNMPSHTHSGSTNSSYSSITLIDSGHNHALYSNGQNFAMTNSGSRSAVADSESYESLSTSTTIKTASTSSGIAVSDSAHNHSFTTGSSGSGTSFSIIPSHYTVNYIIKY